MKSKHAHSNQRHMLLLLALLLEGRGNNGRSTPISARIPTPHRIWHYVFFFFWWSTSNDKSSQRIWKIPPVTPPPPFPHTFTLIGLMKAHIPFGIEDQTATIASHCTSTWVIFHDALMVLTYTSLDDICDYQRSANIGRQNSLTQLTCPFYFHYKYSFDSVSPCKLTSH